MEYLISSGGSCIRGAAPGRGEMVAGGGKILILGAVVGSQWSSGC